MQTTPIAYIYTVYMHIYLYKNSFNYFVCLCTLTLSSYVNISYITEVALGNL